MEENNKKKISLRTQAGVLQAELNDNNLVTINIGQPNFAWKNIPLAKDMDNKNLKIKIKTIDNKEITGGFSLSVGNPHVVFFVEDLSKFNLEKIGPEIENHIFFPEKCNVTLAAIKNKKNIQIKVWERGAGLTKACGTAACATAVAGFKNKLVNNEVDIKFKEGFLNVKIDKTENIFMTGPVSEIETIDFEK